MLVKYANPRNIIDHIVGV